MVVWLTKSSQLNKSFHYSEFNNHQRVPPVPATPEQLLDQPPPHRTLPISLVVLADDPDQPAEALGHAVPLQHHAQLADWPGQKTLPSGRAVREYSVGTSLTFCRLGSKGGKGDDD